MIMRNGTKMKASKSKGKRTGIKRRWTVSIAEEDQDERKKNT